MYQARALYALRDRYGPEGFITTRGFKMRVMRTSLAYLRLAARALSGRL